MNHWLTDGLTDCTYVCMYVWIAESLTDWLTDCMYVCMTVCMYEWMSMNEWRLPPIYLFVYLFLSFLQFSSQVIDWLKTELTKLTHTHTHTYILLFFNCYQYSSPQWPSNRPFLSVGRDGTSEWMFELSTHKKSFCLFVLVYIYIYVYQYI